MGRIIAFTGPSNSGKTTVIERLTQLLLPHSRVVVVKHDPGDKAQFDQEGKDSYRFFNAGADVFVVSPTRTSFFSHSTSGLERIVQMAEGFDYLFIEGLRTWPVPRIGVFSFEVERDYLPYVQALIVSEQLMGSVSGVEVPVFTLTDLEALLKWIDENALIVGL